MLNNNLKLLEKLPGNYLQSAQEIFEELGDLNALAATLVNLAELHQKLGQLEQAMKYCNEALAIATELNIPLLHDCQELAVQLSVSLSQSK